MTELLRVETADGIATVTLDRPEVRNALSAALLRELRAAFDAVEADDEVAAVVLTGADPAFCAGLDLKELRDPAGSLGAALAQATERAGTDRGPLARVTKPVIGAVNGVAVTGGLELALACSFLVASERAAFADTHSRVGVQPAWGLTVLLPEAVGVRRAREMSATGRFVDAGTALAWGLVDHVVPHDELLPTCRALAADIVANDRVALRRLLQTYEENLDGGAADGWAREAAVARAWLAGRRPSGPAR